MRIAVVRRAYGGVGGAELYTERLISSLGEDGHEVRLLSGASACALPGKAKFVQLQVPHRRSARVRGFSEAVKQWRADNSVDCVFSLERIEGCDVLRAGDGLHSVWLDKWRKYAPWWKKWRVGLGAFHNEMLLLEKKAFDPNFCRRIIVNSQMVKNDILSRTSFPAQLIHLVRNGVDVQRFQNSKERDSLRRQLGLSLEDYILLFIGSGWERKGLYYVIEAMRKLGPSYKLIVAGKGRPPFFCPNNVSFLGSITNPEHLFAAADLMVFPPIYEPSSNVVFESLAAGLPVITSKDNGAHEIIREGLDGMVVHNPADITTLAKAIVNWRKTHGDERVRIEFDTSMDRNVKETLEVINLTLEDKKLIRS